MLPVQPAAGVVSGKAGYFLYYRKAPGLCNIHKEDDKKISYYDKKVQAAF